jgi:hypothetical protein
MYHRTNTRTAGQPVYYQRIIGDIFHLNAERYVETYADTTLESSIITSVDCDIIHLLAG